MADTKVVFENGCRKLSITQSTDGGMFGVEGWFHDHACRMTRVRSASVTDYSGYTSYELPGNWEFL